MPENLRAHALARRPTLRTLGATAVLAFVASLLLTASAGAYTSQLKRYPYLTDVVGSSATVNFGTDQSATTAVVKWGPAGGSCTTNTATATRTAITVNSVAEYQWSATFAVTPNTQYCYRVYLGSGPQIDLLGTDPSPTFFSQIAAGSSQPFSFAVFGDWGDVSTGANPDQANLMSYIANSGVRFAITTGDNSYPNGSQTNYGDLAQTGANISGVFGQYFWTVPGRSIPIYPTTGNHGYTTGDVHLLNWPQTQAVSSSNGRYVYENYCCLNGTTAHNYPSAWYAFNAGNSRFYILSSSWADSNVGTADLYKNDYDYHWTPTSAEYQWLQNDLATHPSVHKFAFWHFPLYSDQKDEPSDTWLQSASPPQPPSSLEGLLSANGVDLGFTGHAHIYQRNLKPHSNSLPTYVTGGGGADSQSIAGAGCSSVDAYGIGWSDSSNHGNSCGAASPPTSRAQVVHFLKVTVNGTQVTVTPTNSLGQTFDVQTYGTPTPSADLSLTKSDSPDPVQAGQQLTYTLTATNQGPSTANSVQITDNLPAGVTFVSATPSQGTCQQASGTVTCSLASLSSGASATATVRVTPQNAGTLTNTASVAATESDPNTGNNSASAQTQVNPSANLSLTKTDSPDPVAAGQQLTYTLTAQNAGPSTATSVQVTDTLPGGVTFVSATPSQGTCGQSSGTVTCSMGSLASGASATVTVRVTPQSAGTITNTASVGAAESDPNSANNSASAQTQVTPSANLSLTKTDSPDPVSVGQQLTYTLTASNAGPSPATSVQVTDTLPAGVLFVSATPSQGTCGQSSGTVTCSLGSLASGANATVTVRVTPQSAGTITNTASVAATEPDPNAANNSASAQTQVNPSADVSLSKSDSPDPVSVGQQLTYTLTASNAGPSPATSVQVTDTLPAGVTYQSATPSQGTCGQSSGTVTCSLGSLASGANATVTVQVTPQSAGTITNTAGVAATEPDPNAANNSSSAQTQVNPSANLSLTKTDSPDPVAAGQQLTYTLTTQNAGPSTATNVQLADSLPAGVTYQSATPSQGTCQQASGTVTCALGSLTSGTSATVTVQVLPQNAGTITNTASVGATEPDPNAANNSASAQTQVNPSANLSLTKTDSPDPVSVGQPLTYTLTANNAGPSPATSVQVTDPLPAGVTYQSATPSQGTCQQASGTVTCSLGSLASAGSATVTVNVTPQGAGTLTNTASVAGAEFDPSAANNSASAQTQVNPSADLSLTKTDSPDPVAAGQQLTYTLTAQNAGPSTATSVQVTDTLPAGVTYQSATPSQGSCSQLLGTVTCSLGSLSSGASATVDLRVTPQGAGTLTNTASVQASEADPNSANNGASANTQVTPSADLSLTKSDAPDPAAVGQPLTYTLTAQNAGPSPATSVQVTDALPAGVTYQSANPSQGTCQEQSGTVTCDLGGLASAASTTVEVQVTPQNTGLLSNTASVEAAEPDPNAANNTGSADTQVNPEADLSITKTDSPDPVTVGQQLTYTLSVENAGPSDASSVQVTDNLPAGVTYQSANPSQGTCQEQSGTVTCDLGSLASGGSATIDLAVTPQGAGTLTNTAGVQAAEADLNSTNNTASADTQVTPSADLSITKTDSPDPVTTGQQLTYTLTAHNAGPSPATSVQVTDSLPAGVTYQSATPSQGTCGQSSGTVTCSIGTLSSGASTTVDVRVTPQGVATLTNTASAQAAEPDPATANNSATEQTTVVAVSYEHPASSAPISVSLVPVFRQCGTGASPANSEHSPPLAVHSCGNVQPSANAARIGGQSVGTASFDVVPGDPGTTANEADVNLAANVTDVQQTNGLDYNPALLGPDLTLLARFRMIDSRNGPSQADSGTTTDFDFRTPVDCTVTIDISIGSTCSVNTTANAVVPGAITEGAKTIIQVFRVRLNDAGPNGTQGDSDDTIFEQQGFYAP